MHSAFLVAKAEEAERCGAERSGTERRSGKPVGVSTDRLGGNGSAAAGQSAGVGSGGEGGGGGASVGAGGEHRIESLESLAAFVAEGEGGRWRTDWTAGDRASFRRGIFAFRRDFHRVRAAFLPHMKYGDVVEYFYR